MRKAKQVFVSILAVLCLLSATASALELPRSARALPGETVEPRAEKTEWRYRMYNGKLQKRLWSITYGKWLTEWEDVKP